MNDVSGSAVYAIGSDRPEEVGLAASGRVIDPLFALLALVSIVPAVLVRFPESVDYLNHLVRLFILTAPTDHPVHGLYRVEWHLMPNLAVDLVGVALAPVLPIELAMKLIWILCVLGMAAAVWFLHRSIHGRTEPTLLLAAPCLLSLPVTAGFLGFALALAAAVATVALWFRMGDRATVRTLLIVNVASAAIAVLHVAAATSLAFTIVSLHALQPPWALRAVLRRGLLAATGFLAPSLLLLMVEHAPADPTTPSLWSGLVFAFAGKPTMLLDLVFTGNRVANAAGAVALVLGLYLVLRPPGGSCSARLGPTLIAWVLLLLVMPQEIGRAVAIDRRLAMFPALLFLGGLGADALSSRRRWAVVALVTAAILVRSGAVIPAWRDYNVEIAALRAMSGAIEPKAKVLVVEAPPSRQGDCDEPTRWPPFFHHAPALLVVDRAAFVPMLFAAPGMQPIRVAEPYRAIAEPGAPIVPWADLMATETQEGRTSLLAAARQSVWRQPYFLDWRRSYDYLLLLKVRCADAIPADERLTPLGNSGAFRLYRIEHG